MLEEGGDVRHRPVRQVVDPDDFVAVVEQSLADVRPDEAGRAGDPDPSHFACLPHAAARWKLGNRSKIPGATLCATPVTAWPLTISGYTCAVDASARFGIVNIGGMFFAPPRRCTGSVTRARCTTELR